MYKYFCKTVFLILSIFCSTESFAQQIAFPGAEGYGKYTVGGRGGAVYEVTNLNDSGTGSLRAAVAASGPRTVVFRVSGTITLNSDLKISNPNITIAGQTAPGDGICLRKYTLVLETNQIIIRHIRCRLGNESGLESDAVSGRGCSNIILDHVSASWSVDETMSIYFCNNMTIQNCLVAESMYNSNHIKGAHGFGGIWGSNYGSYHHNLLAHHSSRNPRFASGCGNTDYRNNVVYNWGYNSTYGGEMQQVGDTAHAFSNINMVANYYKPGPATKTGTNLYRIANPSTRDAAADYGKWYVAENVMVGNAAVTTDNWNGGIQPSGGSTFNAGLKLAQPWAAMPINQQTATEAYYTVLENAGATLPKRDIIDQHIISDTRNGNATFEGPTYRTTQGYPAATVKSGMIDTQTDVGGWPILNSLTAPTDSDHDGMPDSWETARGLNPNNAADRNTVNADGYTNLERYLNGDELVAKGTVNTCVNSKALTASNTGKWLHAKDTISSILICTDTMNLFASIKDMGNYGSFSASYYVTNTKRVLPNNKPLLNRNVTIVPTTPASITSPVTVRLYFTVAEYNALKAADATILTLNDLRVLRKSDNNCLTTISSANEVITPTSTGTYGTYTDGYYVEFLTSNFGSFFIAGYTATTATSNIADEKTFLNFYPNPATTTVTVNHSKATSGTVLNLINVEGKVVKQLPLSIGAEQTILDLKDLNNGVYMLVFKNETTNMSVKLIKN